MNLKIFSLMAVLITPLARANLVSADGGLPSFETLTVEVNGAKMILSQDTPFEVVEGDLFTVLNGWVKTEKLRVVDTIDIAGFSPKTPRKFKDDSNFVIDSSKDLQKSFAVDKDRSNFEVKGFVNGKLVAKKILHVVKARLDRVEVTVNGLPSILKDGETLFLKATDRIAVTAVVTNVAGNENVVHDLKTSKAKSGKTERTLIFARGNQVIGRIPIQWQE